MLEGPESAVDALIRRIGRDQRHRDCKIIERRAIAIRAFPAWSLAYCGSSIFVAATIEHAAAGARRGHAADIRKLVKLMAAFAAIIQEPPPV